MVEIDIVWHVMNPIPDDGLVGLIAIPHQRQHGAIRPDLRMAGHAGVGGWHPGKGRILDAGMTIATVEAKCLDMVLMAKLDRLGYNHAHMGDIGRIHNGINNPAETQHKKEGAKDAHTGKRIRTWMKDL